MPDLGVHQIVFLTVVIGFTLAAAIWDYRYRRIPNKLTLPVFVCGLVYQLAFNGWSGHESESLARAGLGSAMLAFAMGFGTLFVLWMIGGGGGGDVKLMGALSVWLGTILTLWVLILSTALVLFGTLAVIIGSTLARGPWKTREKYLATGQGNSSRNPAPEGRLQRQQRRLMAYAIPVATATWMVLLWKLPLL